MQFYFPLHQQSSKNTKPIKEILGIGTTLKILQIRTIKINLKKTPILRSKSGRFIFTKGEQTHVKLLLNPCPGRIQSGQGVLSNCCDDLSKL